VLFSEETSPVSKYYVFSLPIGNCHLWMNALQNTRIKEYHGFSISKEQGGKTVCSTAQFHHVKQTRDGLSIAAFRWRPGVGRCEKKEIYVLCVLGNVAWEPHSGKTKRLIF
jgi:hypothetical protein